MSYDAANNIQDFQAFGEYGEVNPSISDGATFTFLTSEKMEQLFHEEVEGCFLYSRHLNPTNYYLSEALAALEGTECAQVMGSGMGAISTALMQLVESGDEIISSRTIYGGSYALMKNFLPKYGVKTHFINITKLSDIEKHINEHTKVIYCETISNPLLEIADIPAIRKLADKHNITVVVDNTFCPMVISPYKLGAHVVVYSMTKFINGTNDCVAGAVCGTYEFISKLRNVIDGAAMLLGPTLDPMRATSILKNIRTLHLRMKQHSANAMYVAEHLEKLGIKVYYPGLPSHPQHQLAASMVNPEFGYSGMITIDCKDHETANALMVKMQEAKIGFFAVSLGFYKTLFSSPGSSTSSEIPVEEQKEMGMKPGLVRFSMGIDADVERTFQRITNCMKEVNLLK